MDDEIKPSSETTVEPVVPLKERVEKTRTRQRSYTMDLRVHSPSALGYFSVDNLDTAPALVRLARVKGIDVIAVTDFYSASFIDRITSAAKDSTLTVIPGVDLRCRLDVCDDVIITCLFPEGRSSADVEGFLEALAIPRAARGDQKHVVQKPFAEVLAIVEKFQGVCLPSRVDKTPQRLSILSRLVEEFGFRAFDLAYNESSRIFKSRWPKIKFHLFSFSDATALAQVGSRMAKVKMQSPGFEGIRTLVSRAFSS